MMQSTVDLVVIGDPVGHSLSPCIHTAMLQALGLSYGYGIEPVAADELAAWLDSERCQRLRGFNATMPHKRALLPFMQSLSADAQRFSAVNTVVVRPDGLHGYNTDGEGLLRMLAEAGVTPQGRRVVLYGAGGAARSTALKLADSGAAVCVCCRRPAHVQELASLGIQLTSVDHFQTCLEHCDLLINCTPLGMEGCPDQFPSFTFLETLPTAAVVCDLIYNPLETQLLLEARTRGHQTVNGLGMLIHQAVLALELFLGQPLDTPHMVSVVREALRARGI